MKWILISVATLIVAAVLAYFLILKNIQSNIESNMPEEGKQIFSMVDDGQCSEKNCSACDEFLCLDYTSNCKLETYTWVNGDKGYMKKYCVSTLVD